jgi:hypothetical protein
MKSRILLTCAAIAMMATAGFSQTIQPSNATVSAPITGIWRCQMNGLPAVTLTMTDEGGSLTGAVLFYLHRREPGQQETATPGVPEPLFNPKFDGQTLTFQVSHRRAHPPGSLQDAPMTFQVRLIAPDKAELINDQNQRDPNAPTYVLLRTDY